MNYVRSLGLLTLLTACSAPAPKPAAPPPTVAPPVPKATVAPVARPLPVAPVPVAPVPTPAPAPPVTFAGAQLVFSVVTGDWTNQIVIAPWGDVIAIGGHKATVLARDTGKELLSIPVCFTQSVDAATFVDDSRMVIACDEVVQEVLFPGGGVNQVFEFPKKTAAAAVGGGRVVAGIDGFWNEGETAVTVYRLGDFQVVDRFDASAKVEEVAISPDGITVAVGTDGGGIDIRHTSTKKTKRFLPNSKARHSMVHFDPTGKLLMADAASSQAGEIDLASGKIVRSFAVGVWGRAVRYIDATNVLMTGSDGLALLSSGASVTSAPIDRLGEGLDLSSDKSYFCASGRGGQIACFSNRQVQPSTFTNSK